MNNKLIKVISVAFLATAFTSCLKDKNIEDQKYGIEGTEDKKIIELFSDDSHFSMTGLDFVNKDTVIKFAVVRLAAADPASEDIKVTLTLASSATLIADYNAVHGTSFTVFPSNLYTLQGGGLIVTIPKGSREGYAQIKVNPSTFDPSSSYAIGFSIASVDKPGYIISQNFKTYIAAIGAKNKYDGVYAVKGYAFLGANTVAPYLFNAPCSFQIWAITSGPNSITMDAQPLFRGTPPTTTYGFSNVIPAFTFDPITNKVTAVTPAPGSVAMNYPIDGGMVNGVPYDSRYDPVKKEIYVSFGANNSATWRIRDTLTYCGPR